MNPKAVPVACRADHAEATATAMRFIRSLRKESSSLKRERRANRRLAAEWIALIGVTYVIAYAVNPAWLKLALLVPWSIFSSLALDNITHYANHWPLFERRAMNAVWRASGVLAFFNTLEIKYVHREHHRSYDAPTGEEDVFAADGRARSFGAHLVDEIVQSPRALIPWRSRLECIERLRTEAPRELREIVLVRWACFVWALVLLVLDWRDTAFYFLPATIVIATFASWIMNLTDHIPGDSTHPFRLATFCEPRGAREEFYSAVNHYTAATHLTHHLFPSAHWIHLRELQRELVPIYERQAAPRSLLVNSLLVGNPLWAVRVLREVRKHRFPN